MCGTAYHGVPRDGIDAFLSMHKMVRNVSILSGACCALRKDVFLSIGGFDSLNTPDGHSDLDLSYKLDEAGFRCVCTPHAVLRHVGNHSWGAKTKKYKADIFCLKRWGRNVSSDPYFTSSMKRVLHYDFPFEYKIHAKHVDPRANYTGPDVLLVSHALTHTGAPRMLLYAAQAIKRNGGFPVIASPEDGPLRESVEKAGFAIIIDESINHNHYLFERFAQNFDLVIVNTIFMFNVVQQLSPAPLPRTLWWLHESRALSLYSKNFEGIEWKHTQTLCVSQYAKAFLPTYVDAEVLHNGVPDDAAQLKQTTPPGPMTFLLSGTIEPRKGYDTFIDAISLLPPDIRKQCRFLMSGAVLETDKDFGNAILRRADSIPEVSYLGSLNHDGQLQAMKDCDVVVCCSRDDAFSLVVAEAAMLSIPAIISDHVGVGEVLGDGASMTFPTADSSKLSEQLRYAFEHRGELKRIGAAARQKFEEHLSLESFEGRFLTIIDRLMN
jgi:O-antigen biosynthesis protein